MRLIAIFCLLFVSLQAHKLYVLANDNGKTLHVKSYFTKSSYCQNCEVNILDKNGKVLYNKKTDLKGEADFPFTKKELDIEVIASMGHKNKISYISENEVTIDKNESYGKMLIALGLIVGIFFLLKLVKK